MNCPHCNKPINPGALLGSIATPKKSALGGRPKKLALDVLESKQEIIIDWLEGMASTGYQNPRDILRDLKFLRREMDSFWRLCEKIAGI